MSGSINYARNLRRVHVFDGRENHIGEYETVTACADALGVTRQAVTMAVTRASILDKKYYVSHQQKFTRQQKQKEFNPLRPSVVAPRSAAVKPTGEAPAKRASSIKPAALSPAKVKAATKRVTDMALRSRSILLAFDDEVFGPFSAFH